MKLYYRAVTQDGKTIRGVLDAKDPEEAANYLRRHQFIPVKIIAERKTTIAQYIPFYNKPSLNDLIFFTRQLSSMMASGLTLMQSLAVLKNQKLNPFMEEMVQSVISDVEDGKPLSAAIAKYPQIFSPIYVSLIRTAESSGLLDKILLRLADNLEKQQQLEQTIRSALLYPAIVLTLMIVVIGVMMIFVVPQLTSLYSSLDTELPLTTKIIIGLSNFFVVGWPFVLGGGLLFVILARRWYHQSYGRRIVDSYLLKMPIFGKLWQETMMAEFSMTLGLLINAGSLVVDSLLKSSEVVGNILYKDAITLVAKRVEKGISIGDAMEASVVFPPMIVEMVKIGEQTGKLDESLLKASEYFEREVEQTVKTLTTLLEPVIMIILAFGVGFLIFAIITPIYNIISTIQ